MVRYMKTQWRQRALEARAQRDPNSYTQSCNALLQHLSTLLQSAPRCTVALYYPVRGEPDLLPLLNDSSLKHLSWALPVCVGQGDDAHLAFHAHEAGAPLAPGRYGIPVPAKAQEVQPQILLIPCVGFDRSGARLGYGAGWYDRTLARLAAPVQTIGVAFSDAEISQPFAQAHDRLLDCIVTDREVIGEFRPPVF